MVTVSSVSRQRSDWRWPIISLRKIRLSLPITCSSVSVMPARDVREKFVTCLGPARRIHCYRLGIVNVSLLDNQQIRLSWQASSQYNYKILGTTNLSGPPD